MTAALPYRPWLTAPALAGGSLIFGALIATRPVAAVGLVGLAIITLLAFAAPVWHLLLLVFITAIVPYGTQNEFGIGGGAGSAGLLLSDILIMTGLARAAWALVRRPPGGLRLVLVALIALFVAAATVQLARGVFFVGYAPSEAGAEFRVLLGFGAALLAIPLLREPAQRELLIRGLTVFALVLGLWGIVQWAVEIPFVEGGDVGVREGVRFTTEGRGQIQGGLYAFAPVCVVLVSLLIAGGLKGGMRLLVLAALTLNAISLVLTYERTFWVAGLLAVGFVIVRTGGSERVKAIIATPLALAVFLVVLATVAPTTLGAARERLLSIGQYSSDNSLRYRIVESRYVVDRIEAHPFMGSAPGAQILWGRPWEGVKPSSTEYAHNGYLWLTWKLGIPVALLLLIALVVATVRPPPEGAGVDQALVRGCQGAILTLLIASVTFPSFSALSITPLMALFAAIAVTDPSVSSSRST